VQPNDEDTGIGAKRNLAALRQQREPALHLAVSPIPCARQEAIGRGYFAAAKVDRKSPDALALIPPSGFVKEPEPRSAV
jgi:hypothetical protein